MKSHSILKRGALLAVLLVLTGCSRSAEDFSIILGGDVMLSRAGEVMFDPDHNPWGELATTLNAEDYFFINLESPLGKSSSTLGEMNLCADSSQVDLLLQAGVDLASLSNNHQNDCQPGGLQQTTRVLTESGILSTGPGFDSISIETEEGVKIAVIAANEVTGSLDESSLLSSIRKTRENADLVIVSMHWGNEYQAGAEDWQKVLAQEMADAGADVIWGHHPHVLQRMEWLEASDGRTVLALYSLGNLLTDQRMLADTQQSALVSLTFTGDTLQSIEIIPIGMMDRGTKLHIIDDAQTIEKIGERLQLSQLSAEYPEVAIQLMNGD